MKRTSIALIAAGGLLAGCVAYETPVSGTSYGSVQGSYYTTDGRIYTSGGTGPYYTTDGRAYYSRDGHNYYQRRDRDGDGIADRRDRDRDGDGVRNSQDRAPDNRNRN